MWWKKKRNDIKRPFVSAIIPAAGSSARMGEDCNKLLMPLGGIPLLMRTLMIFEHCSLVDEIVIVCREGDMMTYAHLCESFGMNKVSQLVRGGDSRAESVLCGIKACAEQTEFVAIHDGARPLLQQDMLRQIITDAMAHGAATPLVPMKDSIKRIGDGGFIAGDVPRESIMAAQTPQVFAHQDILRALTSAIEKGLSPTDDCAAAELLGIALFLSHLLMR